MSFILHPKAPRRWGVTHRHRARIYMYIYILCPYIHRYTYTHTHCARWQWLIERSTANVTRSSLPSHRPLILYAPWGCPHPSRPFGISCSPCLRVLQHPLPPVLLLRRIAPQFSTSLSVHYAISRPRDDDTVWCFIDLSISRGCIVLFSLLWEDFGCYLRRKIYGQNSYDQF